MKTCMLCGENAADESPTCPRDGEATWSATLDAPVAAPVVPESSESSAASSDEAATPEVTELVVEPDAPVEGGRSEERRVGKECRL